MSTCSHQSMINHHEYDFLAHLGDTVHAWRDRYVTRRELAKLTERDLHDIGHSWSDLVYEAEKPFWRA